MSIRARAILAIVLCNFVIILLSILAGTGYARRHIEKYIEADMMAVADIANQFISGELDMLRHEAAAVADSLAAAGPARWGDALAGQAREYRKFAGMAVMRRDAHVAASAGERPASPGLMANQAVQRAFFGKQAFTSTVPEADGVVFYVASPIPGDADHVLLLTLDGMYFSELASGYKVWETGHIFIDDAEGNIIANIRPEWVRTRRNFLLQARENPQYGDIAAVIAKGIAGARGIDSYSLDGVSRVCAYRPISGSGEGWFLGIVAPNSESPIAGFDAGILLIAAVSALLNIVMAVIASDFIKKPFEEVAALKEAAEANSRAKSGFLANMSHEIRTPLNAVVGLSELALTEEKPGAGLSDKLEKIHSSGMTILSIVNDILDISKIEAGKFEILPAPYDLPSLINDVVAQNAVRIGSKDVQFTLDIDERLPARLIGDELRIKQIINNLLSNSFKYTEKGTVELGVRCEREGDGVRMTLRVRDTGCGIRREEMGDLFKDYAQLAGDANRRIGGTGLGLSITRKFAEMMGGSVSVESEYGKGSVFTVTLRQRHAGDAVIGAGTAENLKRFRYSADKRSMGERERRVKLPYARVLVVDDNVTNLDIAKGIMKPYGMRVDCVTSGQQAIDAVRAGTPAYDAVFMDHMMPEMDGMEAARRIRELGTAYAEHIPIIALTANAVAGNEAMFLRSGFQAFIAKPIDLGRLDEVIRNFVRDRKREASPDAGREAAEAEEVFEKKGDVMERKGGETEAGGFPENAGRGLLYFGAGVAGLDLARGIERFGDEKTFTRILRSYAVNTKALLAGIAAVDKGNLAEYATIVHGIKGSCRNIFAMPLGDQAEALERAAKDGDLQFALRNNPAFLDAAGTLIGEIEAALDAAARANPLPRKSAPDLEVLLRLRDACDDYDMDGIDEAMEEIERYDYDADGGLAAALRESVTRMDYGAVVARLASVIGDA